MGDINTLLEQWCDLRAYGALAVILPAWVQNDYSPTGWRRVLKAFTDLRNGLEPGALQSTLDRVIFAIGHLAADVS
jgi:hypothetical protein